MQLVIYIVFISMLCVVAGMAGGLQSGIVYHEDNAFILDAPRGWVLDNQSGVERGAHAVFYPKESTWEDSAVVMYAHTVRKQAGLKSAREQVRRIKEDYLKNGSPDIKIKRIKSLKAGRNKKGTVYHFQRDRWNTFKAVACFEEKKVVNFIVMHSNRKQDFESSLGLFEALAKSYKPLIH